MMDASDCVPSKSDVPTIICLLCVAMKFIRTCEMCLENTILCHVSMDRKILNERKQYGR